VKVSRRGRVRQGQEAVDERLGDHGRLPKGMLDDDRAAAAASFSLSRLRDGGAGIHFARTAKEFGLNFCLGVHAERATDRQHVASLKLTSCTLA